MTLSSLPSGSFSTRSIIRTWWPLAASWVLMALEAPALSAIVARLADPEVNLAAYSGIVFPLALIIESPIIMLLAASTTLSKDWASFVKVRHFMTRTSIILTALHFLIAFTPLYDLTVKGLIGAPQQIIEPARIGLMIMMPWTWSIAYRRFHQGVLIRFNRSREVGAGTVIRLVTNGAVLLIGYRIGTIPGIVVATSAVATGVICEAVYIGWRTRPVLDNQLKFAPTVDPPLTFKAFIEFYVPLAMTSLLMLLAQPIGSAAISRMPQPVESLAIWLVVTSLIFLIRSLGVAYNEVVVALLDVPQSALSLRNFATALSLLVTALIVAIAATPLAAWWFGDVLALAPPLVELARLGLWIALPIPATSVLQSWYQGTILYSRQTRGISESVVVYLVVSGIVLIAGVIWGKTPGLFVGLMAFSASMVGQTAWLWFRSRPAMRSVWARDAASAN
ncbi:MAG: hypothetical protein JXB30_01355 [Anaerolineae bacterium]|nr:hypothetical protein [Anaerolineae bacterium]